MITILLQSKNKNRLLVFANTVHTFFFHFRKLVQKVIFNFRYLFILVLFYDSIINGMVIRTFDFTYKEKHILCLIVSLHL